MAHNKSVKALETKKRILEAALKLFLEEGYEHATMRKIARLANLTPGATYYHFKTKEHIIFHYYEKSYEDHLIAARAILSGSSGLRERIAGLIRTHLEVASPYHDISKALFRVAASPGHSLSPFSEESRPLREKNILLFKEALEGAAEKVPASLLGKLPELLWLFKMLIIIFWLYDASTQQQRTYRLIDKSTDLVVKLIAISNLPVVRSFTEQLANLILEFKPYS